MAQIYAIKGWALFVMLRMLILPAVLSKALEDDRHANTSSSRCDAACDAISQLLPTNTWIGPSAATEIWSLFQANARPRCRVAPKSAEEVAAILGIIVHHSCLFAVLGGGTSPFANASNRHGGVTIDLARMNKIQLLSDNSHAVQVGGGVIWADLYRFLDPYNLTAVGTRNSLTGVVGSILGGGISFFSQRHGWSCDNVISFEVVLGNSSIVEASEHVNADLYWALRGGGNNFGIITSIQLDVFPQPSSWYTFQRWDMRALESVFERLGQMTHSMPENIQMVATTLGWSNHLRQFVISERLVATDAPLLPRFLPIRNSAAPHVSSVLEEYVYVKTTLEMAQKMDRMNEYGFYNYFGSITIQSQTRINMEVANIFFDEVEHIKDATGLQVYIVYNPVSVPAMEQMRRRGGNALGLEPSSGPLTIVNINLHWSMEDDTPRMKRFITSMIARVERASRLGGASHPYIFLNHCFEEQLPLASYGDQNVARLQSVRDAVDPSRVFHTLQPGHHKLGLRKTVL